MLARIRICSSIPASHCSLPAAGSSYTTRYSSTGVYRPPYRWHELACPLFPYLRIYCWTKHSRTRSGIGMNCMPDQTIVPSSSSYDSMLYIGIYAHVVYVYEYLQSALLAVGMNCVPSQITLASIVDTGVYAWIKGLL